MHTLFTPFMANLVLLLALVGSWVVGASAGLFLFGVPQTTPAAHLVSQLAGGDPPPITH